MLPGGGSRWLVSQPERRARGVLLHIRCLSLNKNPLRLRKNPCKLWALSKGPA
jgi:hypothetical protein